MSTAAISREPVLPIVGVGLYTIGDAARLLGRHFNTVRSWVRQGLAPAPVHLVYGETTILSFHDLISLMIVRRLRDEGVTLEHIRNAEEYLRRAWNFQRPFATQRIMTNGNSVILALEEGGFTAADRLGQEFFADIVGELLRDVTYDALTELANCWRPRAEISLKPDVQFGQPCVVGTRLTTRTLAELVHAGDTPALIAETYSVSVKDVNAAVLFEEDLLRKAA